MSGRSDAIIERLHALHPKLIDLSLERLRGLLEKLGHPERALPPVVHVAGTNGKGSTCATLRAIGEAAGQRVHVYASPHLVRFHERVRLAGALVAEDVLAAALEEVEAANGADPITVFEITTAVALLLFSRTPADLLVLEVGLGGRFDATNVVERPVATAIASVSMDHMEFLGETLAAIAFEKAGILKPGVPCATGAQHPEALAVIEGRARELGAPLFRRGHEWEVAGGTFRDARDPEGLEYRDARGAEGLEYRDARGPEGLEYRDARGPEGLEYRDACGAVALPRFGLLGAHQPDNAGIAIAALRAWNPPWLTDAALAEGVAKARWPARMQRLHGELAGRLPQAEAWELWLDGGHNAGAGQALAATLAGWRDRPLHLVVGMKQGKTAAGFLQPLLPLATSVTAVREPGQHLAMEVAEIVAASGGVARPGPDVAGALAALRGHAAPGRVLICGSLYLAGEVLKADGSLPD